MKQDIPVLSIIRLITSKNLPWTSDFWTQTNMYIICTLCTQDSNVCGLKSFLPTLNWKYHAFPLSPAAASFKLVVEEV